ncbi:penicillin-binding transpeptidase domain-containing protein [Streptacidiphilus sp. MAP5-3]|uniref:penicillin-binding transpeptidase domain-containing protein n=1 Tax=unclassified Streptacidiphilus TaxID=2643834 RepID=UPI003511DCA8
MNKAAKIAVATTVAAVLAGGAYAAVNVVHAVVGSGSDSGAGSAAATFDPTALATNPPSSADAQKLATAFLQSWQSGPGHYGGAASDTDSPTTAQAALQSYHDGLALTGVTFTGITPAGPDPQLTGATKVNFSVAAQVKGGTWSYPGTLDVVQSTNGTSAVHWASSVLYPKLTDGQNVQAGAVTADPGATTVTDRNGTQLTAAQDPSLSDILATIAKNGQASGGSGGAGVEVIDSSNSPVAPATVFTAPKAATIQTTLDAHLQQVAENAVRQSVLQGMATGVVVIDPQNGHILAIANTASDVNLAINGSQPPGSTMKIVTSTALFDNTGLTPSSVLPCPKTLEASSESFNNESDVPDSATSTMTQAFAESCNTAFIKAAADNLTQNGQPASALHDTATQVFGFGDWSIGGGVATQDPSVPADPSGGDRAAQYIGQGQVVVSPLVMASVAATVQSGSFHQPILIPGQAQTPASTALSSRDDGYLQHMMSAVAQYGTAAPRLGDLSGVGAKTGTAEVANGTDGWMVAYNSNIAVCALVQGGSSGVDSAGYVVRPLLLADGS